MNDMNLATRLLELSRIRTAPSPVVSLYLNTQWSDERQRERARVFIKNGVGQAHKDARAAEMRDDLDWIETEAMSLVDQMRFPEAHGAVLFACGRLGLREVLPLRVSSEDTFVVADRPYLRPLADVLDACPETLVVWVDTGRARLIPVSIEGPGPELTLESEIPGHHSRGGWALLAQSRYQRHIEEHKSRHLDAVVQALVRLVQDEGVQRIVMAGEAELIGAFRKRLPAAVGARVLGVVHGTSYEDASVIVDRALELLGSVEREEHTAEVDEVLTEAAKGGRAVSGLAPTLDAVSRGAIHRLYLLKRFREVGMACRHCGALRTDFAVACVLCGQATTAVELGEAMVERVLQSGGSVETITGHGGLADRGGVAARLRYPLGVRG
jgi:hypothetical protein